MMCPIVDSRCFNRMVERDPERPGWVTISHRFIEDPQKRRSQHGAWYEIKSAYGSIFRTLRFDASFPSADPAAIAVDYIGWLKLIGENPTDQGISLTIQQAKWYQYPKIALSHPEPFYRLSAQIGLISLALGLLSIILAVLPFLLR